MNVNTRIPSARNQQCLRFRLVTAEESDKVLPHIRLGGALPELHLPLKGTEPQSFIIVCSTISEDRWVYIDLGISAQSHRNWTQRNLYRGIQRRSHHYRSLPTLQTITHHSYRQGHRKYSIDRNLRARKQHLLSHQKHALCTQSATGRFDYLTSLQHSEEGILIHDRHTELLSLLQLGRSHVATGKNKAGFARYRRHVGAAMLLYHRLVFTT